MKCVMQHKPRSDIFVVGQMYIHQTPDEHTIVFGVNNDRYILERLNDGDVFLVIELDGIDIVKRPNACVLTSKGTYGLVMACQLRFNKVRLLAESK